MNHIVTWETYNLIPRQIHDNAIRDIEDIAAYFHSATRTHLEKFEVHLEAQKVLRPQITVVFSNADRMLWPVNINPWINTRAPVSDTEFSFVHILLMRLKHYLGADLTIKSTAWWHTELMASGGEVEKYWEIFGQQPPLPWPIQTPRMVYEDMDGRGLLNASGVEWGIDGRQAVIKVSYDEVLMRRLNRFGTVRLLVAGERHEYVDFMIDLYDKENLYAALKAIGRW